MTGMSTVPAVSGRPKYAGVVVAVVGFLLTRFTVLESVRRQDTLVGFVVGPGPFLAVGLGVTVFGLALVVSGRSHRDVTVVAAWCLVGTAAAGLVAGSALLESHLGVGPALSMTGERLLSRVLIGGAAVGVVLGLRSAATGRQSRHLSAQADRLTLLNRILRHEVLNKVNVIRGYATLDSEATAASNRTTIDRAAVSIEEAIDEVGVLTRTDGADSRAERVDLVATIRREVAAAREAYPDAEFSVELPESATVRSVGAVGLAFGHLLDNAVVHSDADRPRVRVSVDVDGAVVTVRVADDGPGLPAEQEAMLASGALPEFDDPRAGFGLTISRMLVEESKGTLRSTSDGDGAELTVTLPRAECPATGGFVGVEPSALVDVSVAAVVSGVVMGLLLQALTGNIAIIGALYGVPSAGVGWLTHEFHSIVFGVGFVAALSGRRLRRYRGDFLGASALGVGYGALLWFVASGFVMPAWLLAVGIPASVPSLSATSLLGHVVWGALLGATFVALRRRRPAG